MMPPDLNPPTNEKGYITGPDKTPHIAATAALVFAGEPGPDRRQQPNVNQSHGRCERCGLGLALDIRNLVVIQALDEDSS